MKNNLIGPSGLYNHLPEINPYENDYSYYQCNEYSDFKLNVYARRENREHGYEKYRHKRDA